MSAVVCVLKGQGVSSGFHEDDADAHNMDESSSRGAFVTTLDLSPGVYQYIFCLDDETWATNPNAPLITLTDGKTVNYIEVIEGENVIATQPGVVRLSPNMFNTATEATPLLADYSGSDSEGDEREQQAPGCCRRFFCCCCCC